MIDDVPLMVSASTFRELELLGGAAADFIASPPVANCGRSCRRNFDSDAPACGQCGALRRDNPPREARR